MPGTKADLHDIDHGFELMKNIIYEQNKALIKMIAKDYLRNEKNLLDRYLKPENYLPIIVKENENH